MAGKLLALMAIASWEPHRCRLAMAKAGVALRGVRDRTSEATESIGLD